MPRAQLDTFSMYELSPHVRRPAYFTTRPRPAFSLHQLHPLPPLSLDIMPVPVQAGAPESEAQRPFTWRGRKSSGVEGGSEADRASWVDKRGLLSKIVDVFMQEPMDSLYRFWLASCVEAFLRGGRYSMIYTTMAYTSMLLYSVLRV